MVELNKGQQEAVEKYYDFIKYPGRRKRPWFEISGPAGSGKTFTVREAIRYVGFQEDLVSYVAYVGKATLALRLNGLNARTIHSFIYDLVTEYAKDENGFPIMSGGHKKLIQKFELKPQLDKDYQQLVADEGGMIGEQIGNDLLSYGIPMMVLGDLAQLPPVMSKRMFLTEPDVQLTEIMRQEKDSPIIYLSQKAKFGLPIRYGVYGDRECIVIPKNKLSIEHLIESDIVICETNRMRDKINMFIREKIQDIHDNVIVPGDKIICRQNKWTINLNDDIALVNGLIGYVRSTYKESKTAGCNMDIDFRPEFLASDYFSKLPIDHKFPFMPYEQRLEVKNFRGNNILFEFGNCITCHLAQGSQYDTVLVYVEGNSSGGSLYFKQWLYTAITRAKKKLILVI